MLPSPPKLDVSAAMMAMWRGRSWLCIDSSISDSTRRLTPTLSHASDADPGKVQFAFPSHIPLRSYMPRTKLLTMASYLRPLLPIGRSSISRTIPCLRNATRVPKWLFSYLIYRITSANPMPPARMPSRILSAAAKPIPSTSPPSPPLP